MRAKFKLTPAPSAGAGSRLRLAVSTTPAGALEVRVALTVAGSLAAVSFSSAERPALPRA